MKKFWAVGENHEYGILFEDELDSSQFGFIDGPFDSLAEAKKSLRQCSRADRNALAMNLAHINFLTEREFKKS